MDVEKIMNDNVELLKNYAVAYDAFISAKEKYDHERHAIKIAMYDRKNAGEKLTEEYIRITALAETEVLKREADIAERNLNMAKYAIELHKETLGVFAR